MNAPSRREPRDDAKAPAAKKRTRKAKRTEEHAAPTPDPTAELSVEALGRGLAETIRLRREVEDEQSAVKQAVEAGTAEVLASIEIDDYEDILYERKNAIESMIAFLRSYKISS